MSDAMERLTSALADRYRIERELGQGGMATVYLADDLKHDRKVALKVLRPELAAILGGERFLKEIQLTANLQHPHILPLHDSGEAAGLLYFVMPFVVGESLRDRLTREKQLPVEDALRITCQVASALDYAHRHNVLHRDIKPENILLEDGHAVLSDFGIARAIGSAAEGRLTSTGLTLGTPAYMSPEQAAGEQTLDGRSDLYSLASVLHEMLAGEPPFTGPTAQAMIAKRLSGPPPRIRAARPSVSATVDDAAEASEQLLHFVLENAQHEIRLRRLAAELKRTHRKVNTIEHQIIPRLERTIREIEMALEEQELEGRFRMRLARRSGS